MKDLFNLILSSVKPDYAALRSMLVRALIVVLVFCVSSVIAIIGLGFFVWSLYLYLETMFSPHWAALMSGGGAIVLAAAVVLIALFFTGFLRKRGRAKTKPGRQAAGLSSDPMDLICKYPIESGLTAAIAGFIVGSSPDAPKTLAEFMSLLKESGLK